MRSPFSRPETIEGDVVSLREMERADVDEIARWPRFVEPEYQWANLNLSTPGARDSWYEHGRSNGTRRRFVVLDPQGQIIGTLGLRNVDFKYGEGTLGIIIAAHVVDRGYGTDAVLTLVRFAFERMGLRKVYLDVAVNNTRARRCYDKCGFIVTGHHQGSDGLRYTDMVIARDRLLPRPPPSGQISAQSNPSPSRTRSGGE